nr:hypothetical protein [Tanacetum cinerariifolium]
MMVQALEKVGEGPEIPTNPYHTPTTRPSSTQPQRKQKIIRKQRKETEVPLPSSEIPHEEGVLNLEEAKTAQAKEIDSLKKRVKKLEQKRKSINLGLKRLWKVRPTRRIEFSTEASLGDQEDAFKQGRKIDDIDQDVEITLVDETQRRMNEEENDIGGDKVIMDVTTCENVEQSAKVAEEVSTAEVTTAVITSQVSKDELTLAQTLIEIKAAKPKVITTAATTIIAAGTRPKEKGIVMQEPSETPLPKLMISS